ncbi:autotransporter outer membrane beta-barrel domain-containing protein [Pseudomonas palleroniana]|uniref:Autotransporter outer membrane beta-barrel domain-containing protein n=1 Tax=Pseudomonas palleroniana TaxID=191390 RepID=A0A109FQI8_9PSED|nr:autotransporter outer membrane beta-barrel domain-containing protein [Pseudomonas palleroniana]KWU52822.1 autotransporter outer membrane beta-barrel domain-containing protein [Pseudomonas palleroniana]UOP09505.1 autotransporter outer membrane beta-barrel domain-containing protein [Pseudomonas palleroniana]
MSFVPRRLTLPISLIVSSAWFTEASHAQILIDTPTTTAQTVGSGAFFDPSLAVTKTGSINSTATAVDIRKNLPEGQRDVFIRNDGAITSGAGFDAVNLGHGNTVRFENAGVISGGLHGISGDQIDTLSNSGTLIGRNGAGLSVAGNGNVYNYGTITGSRDGRLENVNGDGVRIGGIAYIYNPGDIRATGASGVNKNGRNNTSDGVSVGGGYMFNGGTYDFVTPRTGSITGADNGLLVSDGHDGPASGAMEFRNFVDLRGLNGYGARFIGDFDDQVHNGGLISGGNGVALDLGGGNDTLTLYRGARFEGLVDGGSGHNTMILEGSNYYWDPERALDGTVETTRNFDTLKVNGGYWVLNGHNDFREGARVTSGAILNNQGGIAGDVIVDPGAYYKGRGSLNNLIINGRLITDTVVGAPQVNGNLVMNPGSTFEFVTRSDGSAATTHVAGNAQLNGAYLSLQPGYSVMEYPWHSTYTILQAGSITGTFDESYLPGYAFLLPKLSYENNQVNLSYTRNDIEFIDYARTANAARAANSIESITWSHWKNWDGSYPYPSMIPNPNPLYDALLGTSELTASAAIEALAGSSNANLASATLAASAQVGTSMLSAMRQMSSSSSLLVGLESTQTPALAATGIPSSARNLNDPHARARVWLQGIGSYGKLDGQHGTDASQQRTQGSLLGVDWSLSSLWRLGVLGGYSKTDIDSHNVDNTLRSWHVGAYAVRQDGPLALRLGAAYSHHTGDNKRTVAFEGFSDRPKGDYNADSQQAFAELGYALGSGRFSIEPFANLGYQRYHRDSYSEKGGDASLKVSAQTLDNLSSTFGARVAHLSQLDNGISLTPRATLGWRHLYGNVDSETRQAFLVGGDAFSVEGSALDRDSLMVEVGVDVGLSAQQRFSVGYNGELGSSSRNNALVGQWQMSF